MNQWKLIDADTPASGRCLLWCSDEDTAGKPTGVTLGVIYRYNDGDVKPRGHGMHGDWNFTHWMEIPSAPKPTRKP